MKWLEPKVMRQAGSKPVRWWVQAGIILGLGVGCVVIRAVVPQRGEPWPYWAVFLLGLGIGVMGLFCRYIIGLAPTTIMVSTEGIRRNTLINRPGFHSFLWCWDTIGSGRVESATVGGQPIRVLTVYAFDHEEIGAVGLPLPVSLDALAAEFRSRGKDIAGPST